MTTRPAADLPRRQPVLLFVFGMGRSGSSALTRVLSLCGGALPDALVGATEGNPLGHWEPQRALDINDAFLGQHGATWFDPTLRLEAEVSVDSSLRSAYLEQITAFLRALPAAPLQLVKEPRITALSMFWFEAAIRLGYSIRMVIPVRHPQEVVASLATRDGATPELASALWLKYNLLAERHSREFARFRRIPESAAGLAGRDRTNLRGAVHRPVRSRRGGNRRVCATGSSPRTESGANQRGIWPSVAVRGLHGAVCGGPGRASGHPNDG